MDPQWLDYCTQILLWDIVSDGITWGLVIAFFAIVLLLFCVFKPLKRFKSKATVVLPIVMAALALLACVRIVPKCIDYSGQSFIAVEEVVVKRVETYTMPFDSHYIDVYAADGQRIVRLGHSSLIPFDENPNTAYRGTIIYAKNSDTLLYADVQNVSMQ